MFVIKPIHADSIPAAIEKAERYRLLKEPQGAESICRDIIEIDPHNQRALQILLLALTDQFDERPTDAYTETVKVLGKLLDGYAHVYYEGLIWERRAQARLKRGGLGSEHVAYDWYRMAMSCYEKAEKISPAGNDDAILRWNSCARILNRHPELSASANANQDIEEMLE